ncbi:MAG: UDP-N-acetylglucosamine 2-epimerase (non-hydrolyzing) [Synergistales bacterium]|nr:UDP-N-acetylglucosamine 2-epimerase (non-hydrolyzing) [Synergistales bacterium]
MAPVILKMKELKNDMYPIVLATGQHTHMLYQALAYFNITPDYDLRIMKEQQSLDHITSEVIKGVGTVLDSVKPSLVLVHGDTTTTFGSALSSFYRKIPIGHVEAGLRSRDLFLPFPEEMNRVLTDQISTLWFAPTSGAYNNLVSAGADPKRVFVTGNTVIDALLITMRKLPLQPSITELREIPDNAPVLLMTAHRRESWGKPLENLCHAVKDIFNIDNRLWGIIPMHKNPLVRKTISEILSEESRIVLTEPLDYPDFVWAMNRSRIILTDSGGIQEEATALKRPVLVMRDITERPEAYESGTAILVGRETERIKNEALRLLKDRVYYSSIIEHSSNPFGDGTASEKIVHELEQFFRY